MDEVGVEKMGVQRVRDTDGGRGGIGRGGLGGGGGGGDIRATH